MSIKRIVLTSGEPAGVGPDLCVCIAQRDWDCDLVVASDTRLLESAARAMTLTLSIEPYSPDLPLVGHRAGHLRVLDIPTVAAVVPGALNPVNSPYTLALIDRACDGCLAGEFAAMVTAPVQKSAIIEAGFAFAGHTEYLARRVGAALPVMMLAGPGLRVALVTTHLPLAQVPAAITSSRLSATLRIVDADLRRLFGIAAPRILLLGLNPHAGESGHLGREEIDVIAPVAQALRGEGLAIAGPVPADTAFSRRNLDNADVVVAMYHDQGLPVLKYAAFGNAVNITLGLPIVRTSVDHGTALDLARSGQADPGSLQAALEMAIGIAR